MMCEENNEKSLVVSITLCSLYVVYQAVILSNYAKTCKNIKLSKMHKATVSNFIPKVFKMHFHYQRLLNFKG